MRRYPSVGCSAASGAPAGSQAYRVFDLLVRLFERLIRETTAIHLENLAQSRHRQRLTHCVYQLTFLPSLKRLAALFAISSGRVSCLPCVQVRPPCRLLELPAGALQTRSGECAKHSRFHRVETELCTLSVRACIGRTFFAPQHFEDDFGAEAGRSTCVDWRPCDCSFAGLSGLAAHSPVLAMHYTPCRELAVMSLLKGLSCG